MSRVFPKLGIIAGGGELPIQVAEECLRLGRPFHVICLEGQANPDNYAAYDHDVVRIGAAGKSISILKRNSVEEILMVGPVKRPSLASLRPDATALKFAMKSGALKKGDDGLLTALINFLEAEYGFKVIGAEDILANTRHLAGCLGKYEPDETAIQDIAKAVKILYLIAPADIGQGLVIQDGLVIAVEAIEGTDNMIERASKFKRPGPKPVLVKLMKTGQERRADLPTMGLKTVENAANAGFSGIVFDAQGMILMDKEKMVQAADAAGLFLKAIDPSSEFDV